MPAVLSKAPFAPLGDHLRSPLVKPEPIEFVTSDAYLRRRIYPRQGTLLKLIFCRADLLCADDKTEVLTRGGWKTGEQLEVGEDVVTLDHETGKAEWCPAEVVSIFPVEDEPLVSMEGYGHSSLTTVNHRWPVERYIQHRKEWKKEFRQTQELTGTCRVACAAPVSNLPQDKIWEDAFVELVAWYWTEGTMTSGGGAIIGQSRIVNPLYEQQITKCLTTLFGLPVSSLLSCSKVPAWRIVKDTTHPDMTYFRLNVMACRTLLQVVVGKEKLVAPEFLCSLTLDQLYLYINTSIEADGDEDKQPSGYIKRGVCQSSKARLDRFQMVCSLAGVRTVLRYAPVRGRGQYAGRAQWRLSLYDQQVYFTPQTRGRDFTIQVQPHTGYVWCPTTKNHTWLARRDGKVYFTGNTQYDHDVIGEWTTTFTNPEGGVTGIQPDIMERLQMAQEEHLPWFREVLFVGGRRGSKSFLGALAGAYVLWSYLVLGDPQGYFGIDRDKQLGMYVFAAQEKQASSNQWADLNNVVRGARCFAPWVPERPGVERLQVFAPNDDARIRDLINLGIEVKPETAASFVIEAMGSAAVSARGPAAFCLSPDTPVLKADLTWVPIKDLRAGDDLVGIEEYPPERCAYRRLEKSKVLATTKTFTQALRLTFDDGSSVVCSRDHRWLTNTSHGHKWQSAGYCTPGVQVRHLVDYWQPLNTYEAGYLAGAFDGEGCIVSTERNLERGGSSMVQFSQNPGIMQDTVLKMLADMGYRVSDASCYQKCRRSQIRGIDQTLRFMGQIRPKRLMQLSDYLWDGKTVRAGKTNDGFKTVVKVDLLGYKQLIDIQTTTKTFIANGLVSHNCDMFDEYAMVTKATSKSSSEDLWQAATPALDQFRKWAFIYSGSSPYQMTGQFYTEYAEALGRSDGKDGLDVGTILRPEILMVQLASWDIYKDWEMADQIPMYPDGHVAYDGSEIVKTYPHQVSCPQEYDEQMKRLERSNPATFAVERRAQWASVMDAYFSPDIVDLVFEPWPPKNPLNLTMRTSGMMMYTYVGHGDPSDSDANFGFALAHTVNAGGLMPHVLFDYITHWSPNDFVDEEGNPTGHIDYAIVLEDIKAICRGFSPDQVSFDQGYSAWMISELKKWATRERPIRPCTFFKRNATQPLNWTVAEVTKTACGLGYVHAPYYEQLVNEMKFLQKHMTPGSMYGRVDHQTTGPVVRKDCWDAFSNVIYSLIGDRVAALVGDSLMAAGIRGGQTGGFPLSPYGRTVNPDTPTNPVADQLLSASRRSHLGSNTQPMVTRPSTRSGRIITPRGGGSTARPTRWR